MDEHPRVFKRSPHTERAHTLPRPDWRGISHRIAAVVALPVGVWATVATPAGEARLAVGVFAVCIWIMFTVSAIVHLRRWSVHTTEVLFRADHTAIYLAIAGTATPVAALGMPGRPSTIALWVVWTAAVVGIVLEWLPFAAPRGMANTVYLTLGWGAVLTVPFLWEHAGWPAVALLLVGGLFYTVGAAIVGLQRPNPNPEKFGYHEIWHLLVIAAVATHYVMITQTLPVPAT